MIEIYHIILSLCHLNVKWDWCTSIILFEWLPFLAKLNYYRLKPVGLVALMLKRIKTMDDALL